MGRKSCCMSLTPDKRVGVVSTSFSCSFAPGHRREMGFGYVNEGCRFLDRWQVVVRERKVEEEW